MFATLGSASGGIILEPFGQFSHSPGFEGVRSSLWPFLPIWPPRNSGILPRPSSPDCGTRRLFLRHNWKNNTATIPNPIKEPIIVPAIFPPPKDDPPEASMLALEVLLGAPVPVLVLEAVVVVAVPPLLPFTICTLSWFQVFSPGQPLASLPLYPSFPCQHWYWGNTSPKRSEAPWHAGRWYLPSNEDGYWRWN